MRANTGAWERAWSCPSRKTTLWQGGGLWWIQLLHLEAKLRYVSLASWWPRPWLRPRGIPWWRPGRRIWRSFTRGKSAKTWGDSGQVNLDFLKQFDKTAKQDWCGCRRHCQCGWAGQVDKVHPDQVWSEVVKRERVPDGHWQDGWKRRMKVTLPQVCEWRCWASVDESQARGKGYNQLGRIQVSIRIQSQWSPSPDGLDI